MRSWRSCRVALMRALKSVITAMLVASRSISSSIFRKSFFIFRMVSGRARERERARGILGTGAALSLRQGPNAPPKHTLMHLCARVPLSQMLLSQLKGHIDDSVQKGLPWCLVTVNGREHAWCALVQWGEAYGPTVPALKMPKESTEHVAGTCLLLLRGILCVQPTAWHGGDTFMSFPERPSPFTSPSGTQPTLSEGSFSFCLKGNLPKEIVLFIPSASEPGPLTRLDSFYSSSL